MRATQDGKARGSGPKVVLAQRGEWAWVMVCEGGQGQSKGGVRVRATRDGRARGSRLEMEAVWG